MQRRAVTGVQFGVPAFRLTLAVCALSLGPATPASAQDAHRATLTVSATVQPSCRIEIDGPRVRDVRIRTSAAAPAVRVTIIERGGILAIDF